MASCILNYPEGYRQDEFETIRGRGQQVGHANRRFRGGDQEEGRWDYESFLSLVTKADIPRNRQATREG
ncbi:MAG: hypothetical protein V2B18_09820 [Pseudomonadota bacterium]